MNNWFYNKQIRNEIIKHATTFPEEEVCGLIIKSFNGEIIVFPCRNKSDNKSLHYILDPNDYLKSIYIGEILACYHSQIESDEFSNLDKIQSIGHNCIYIMFCLSTKNFHIFDPKNKNFSNPLSKYIGINFKIGENDCYSLIRNFYKIEKNIHLPDLNREKDWYQLDPKRFEKEHNKNFKNFVLTNNPKYGDLIVFKYAKNINPHHLGIYLNNIEFLHHPRNKYSCVESFSCNYKKRVAFYLKYEA